MKSVSPTPRDIRFLKEVTSTNAEALRLGAEGAGHGTVVVAARQTQGRGRHGRSWDSPEGNLHMSILVRPDAAVAPRAPELSFVAAVAIRDALNEAGVPGIQLKWPNDLLLKGRKFGGILLEASHGIVVVGIGINIKHHPAEALYPATSLAEEGFTLSPEELAHLILPDFERRYEAWHGGNFESIRSDWMQHTAHKQGGKLALRLPKGTVEGNFGGMAEDGSLQMEVNGKLEVFRAGDVLLSKG